jgi:hypothetical protein
MADKYTNEQMKAKWQEFEDYLRGINTRYADDLKGKGGDIHNYILYGTGTNDITYNPDHDLKPEIAEEIKLRLKQIFP